jgi:hypothetical protein
MRGEDSHDSLLRRLNERRSDLVERLIRGEASAENIVGGYRDTSGEVRGIDFAIDLVRSILFGERPAEAPEDNAVAKRYGV